MKICNDQNKNLRKFFVTGLFSLIAFAAVLLGCLKVVNAADESTYPPVSASELQYSSNFQKGDELTTGNSAQFKVNFNAPGSSQERVHAGDVFMINLDQDVLEKVTMDLSSTTSSVDPNKDFNLVVNGGSITVTAKRDLPNVQQLSIVVSGTIKSGLEITKQLVNVQTAFTPNGQAKIDFPDSSILVTSGKSDGGGTTPSDTPDQISHAVFGGFGGFPDNSADKVEKNYTDNYVGRTEATSSELTQLYYQHTQDAMSAFGMIKLPVQVAMPKSVTWTLEPTDGHTIDMDSVVPWVDSYGTGGLYHGVNYDVMTPGTYSLTRTPDGKGVVFKCSTEAMHPGWSIDLTFYTPTTPWQSTVKGTGAADYIQMQTSLQYVDQSGATQTAGSHSVQMRYVNPDQTGYTPTLDLRTKTADLSKSLDPDFDFVLGTVTSPEFVKQFVEDAHDPANPLVGDQTIAAGYTFTAKYDGSVFDPAHPVDGTYTLEITAKNAQGNETTKKTTFVVKNSQVVPLPDSAANIVIHYVDVADPTHTMRTIEVPGYNHKVGDPITTVTPSQGGLNLQLWIDENMPDSYHTATTSELKSGQVQTPLPTTWPAKQAAITYYIAKDGTIPNGGGGTTPTQPVTPATPNTPAIPTVTNPTATANPSVVAKKGEAVYALKKIYLYKNNTFVKQDRQAGYVSKPRVYRPMFVVTGYSHSKNGHLRYKVRDVNHLTKNKGKTGYITANWNYVRPVYYQSKHKTLTVINPRGVNAYKNVNLTSKVRNYKQGTVLHVTKFVHHNLTTRYVLSNGNYITGNRKLVKMDKQKIPRYVKVKKDINRYETVNLAKRNKLIKKGTKIRIKNYDYSQANSVTKHGALRYRIAGGYVTGNSKYVKVYD